MHTPANCQPFGRSDRPVAALSALAICDAMSIGFLKQALKGSPAGAVFDLSVAKSQGAEMLERYLCKLSFRLSAGRAPAYAFSDSLLDADVTTAPALGSSPAL